jgi:hypothetical protein
MLSRALSVSFAASRAALVRSLAQDMTEWPAGEQEYRLIHREGTKGYSPQNTGPDGWMTILMAEYQRLPSLPSLPDEVKDGFTEEMAFQGYLLHHAKNPPLFPGRGQGIGDTPT